MSPRQLARLTQASLDLRREREADLIYWRYVSPLGARGQHLVQRLGSSAPPVVVSSTLGGRTFRPGTLVPLGSASGAPGLTLLGEPAPGRRGSSGFSLVDPGSVIIEGIGITRVSPTILAGGEVDQLVTLFGYGFSEDPLDEFEGIRFNASLGEYEADPRVLSVHDVTWISAEEVTVEIDLSADAPAQFRVGLGIL